MSIRIGHKIGKFFVTTGKSGTRVSTKVGGFYVSKWYSNKSRSKKVDDVYYESATEDENIATSKMVWDDFVLTLLLFVLVYKSGLFLLPLGCLLVARTIWVWRIWKNVETESKWLYYLWPVLGLFVTPLAWVWWITVFIVCGVLL